VAQPIVSRAVASGIKKRGQKRLGIFSPYAQALLRATGLHGSNLPPMSRFPTRP
jgi:hypothetical protein